MDSILLFNSPKNGEISSATVLLATSTLALHGILSGETILDCFTSENGVFVVKKNKKNKKEEEETKLFVSKVDFCGVLQNEWELESE